MVGVWTEKGNFVNTGVMINQNIILYWNFYQTPFEKVAFLIVAVLLTIKLDAKIIVDAKFVEKF